MPVTFNLTHIQTSDNGDFVSEVDLTGVNWQDLTIEEFVGDENRLEAGDLTFTSDLITTSANHDWVALYINDILFNVYRFDYSLGSWFESHDEKRDRYTYRLSPIQKVFYDELNNTLIEFTGGGDTTTYNRNMDEPICTINAIDVKNGSDIDQSTTGYKGFTLKDVITSPQGATNDAGFLVNLIVFWGVKGQDDTSIDDVPVIWRGTGIVDTATDEEVVDQTFLQSAGGDVFNMTWLEIYKIAAKAFNAFIAVKPIIISGTPDRLAIEVRVVPKTSPDTASLVDIADLNRKEQILSPAKYRLDGVRITGDNFEFTDGEVDGEYVFETSVAVADFDQPNTDYATALYWAQCDEDAGTPSAYDVLAPWHESGEIETRYSGMLTAGQGLELEAELIYDPGAGETLLRPGDIIDHGSTNYHINRISAKGSILAKIEAIEVN